MHALKMNRSAAIPVVVVVAIVILLIAAAGAASILLKSDNSVDIQDPGVGTELNWMVTADDGSVTGTAVHKIIAQNMDSIVVVYDRDIKQVTFGKTVTTSEDQVSIVEKGSFLIPEGTEPTGEETVMTCDGSKIVDVYVVKQADSTADIIYLGQKNGVPYKIVSGNEGMSYDLNSYDIKNATDYEKSDLIGTVYGYYQYTEGQIKATYFAESDSSYCIRFGDMSTMIVSVDKSTGDIVNWSDEGNENIVIDGITYNAAKSTQVFMDRVENNVTDVKGIVAGYVYDDTIYQLKVDYADTEMQFTQTYTIIPEQSVG